MIGDRTFWRNLGVDVNRLAIGVVDGATNNFAFSSTIFRVK